MHNPKVAGHQPQEGYEAQQGNSGHLTRETSCSSCSVLKLIIDMQAHNFPSSVKAARRGKSQTQEGVAVGRPSH
jgi:hypothetical protein